MSEATIFQLGSDEPEIHVHEDPAAASNAAAERIAVALGGAAGERGRADWTTTGGSTPTAIYRRLAEPSIHERVPWDRVHTWWGDDRVSARADPLSNVRPLDEVILATAAPLGHLHPIAMDLAIRTGDPGAAARAYEAELRAAGVPLAPNGFPAFDVVLVGVGPDGHLFSVFPGSALFDATDWVAAVPAPTHVEPHVERISLHPAIVEAARLPLVVIHGAAKAEMVAAVLGPERDVRRLPAQLARRPGAVWLLDRAAAAGLPV